MKAIKSSLVIILIIWAVCLNARTNDTLKVLFIGNSYTYVNNLPQIFVNLSASGGKIAVVDENALPSYWLEDHRSNTVTLNKISQEIWDYVILQEQSQVPTIDFYRYNSMYPSASYLDYLITNQGSSTVFYMTWGRKYGGQQTIGNYSSPVFLDFFHMQDSLRSTYVEIANILSAIVAPVGMAWGQAFTLNPSVDLWQSDNSHPTFKGSYLAACVFYAILFNESPIGLSYTGGLSAADVSFFQTVAYHTVTYVEPKYLTKPSNFKLFQNYPNPFNPRTTIEFSIPKREFVSLKIYNLLGQEVATLVSDKLNPGNYEYVWDASDFANGVYYYKIETGSFVQTRKLILIK